MTQYNENTKEMGVAHDKHIKLSGTTRNKKKKASTKLSSCFFLYIEIDTFVNKLTRVGMFCSEE